MALPRFYLTAISPTQFRAADVSGVSPGVPGGYPRSITANDVCIISVTTENGDTYQTGEMAMLQIVQQDGVIVGMDSFVNEATSISLDNAANDGVLDVSVTVFLRAIPDGPPTNTYVGTFKILNSATVREKAIKLAMASMPVKSPATNNRLSVAIQAIGILSLADDFIRMGLYTAAKTFYKHAKTLV